MALSMRRYNSVEAAVAAFAAERPDGPPRRASDLSWLAASLASAAAAAPQEPFSADGVIAESRVATASPILDTAVAMPGPGRSVSHSDASEHTSFTASGDEDEHESKRLKKAAWEKTEDMAILDLARRLGTQWGRIADQLTGRTPDAVRNRWHRLHKTQSLLNSFGIQEAATQVEVYPTVALDGEPDQCIKGSGHGRAMWTAEEDALIEEGIGRFGCQWRRVASALPGRSDSSVRNRWQRLQREHTPAAPARQPELSAMSDVRPAPAPSDVFCGGGVLGGLHHPSQHAGVPAAFAAACGDAAPPASAPARPHMGALKRRVSEAFAAGAPSVSVALAPPLGFGGSELSPPPLWGFGGKMGVDIIGMGEVAEQRHSSLAVHSLG
jgi:hypothetical protein